MNQQRIIITGAAGGIASLLAQKLAASGARLCLTDVNSQALESVRDTLPADISETVVADICVSADRHRVIEHAVKKFGGVDMLINAAGINPFGVFADQQEGLIQKTLEINLVGPMLLTRAVLPSMIKAKRGHIVNVGSIFGSIGFAWFAAYSASKFGLRGFSQALRRELQDSGIAVTYVAPRAVKTPINSPAVYEMAKAINMNMDEPADVADKIMEAIVNKEKERYIGFPESLFVRINALFPGVVDRATRKQNRTARKFAG